MTDSHTLLSQYARTGSESAFRELVSRYIDLVYSTAFRLVDGNVESAQDVAQTVFVALADQARTLPKDVMLGGWLHLRTRFAAGKLMRSERRRQLRERQAAEMNAIEAHSESNLAQVAPVLDEAIGQLDAEDRTAILLRFFERKDFRGVGVALGSSEDAARKRVDRALEKLHGLLEHRGATLTSAALGTALATEAVTAAPAGLAANITAAALSGTTITTTAVIAATKAITMTTIHKTLIAAAFAVAVGTGIYEARQAANARAQAQTLKQQRTPLTEQIQQLQRERDEAKNQLAALTDEIAKVKGNTSELLKLRGLVGRQRGELSQVNDASVQTALAWAAKKEKLQKIFAERPDLRIPEMQFLTDKQWLDLVKDVDLDSESGIHAAIGFVRNSAKMSYAPIIQNALNKFIEANNGHLPNDVSQLNPFFEQPIDDAILQRYKIFDTEASRAGWLKGMVLIEKVAGDKWSEPLFAIGPMGTALAGVPGPENLAFPQELKPALESYQAQNPQKVFSDFNELRPYITTPEQQAALDKLIKSFAGSGK